MKRNRLGGGGGGGEMDSLKLAHVLMLLSRGGGGGRVEEKEHMAQPPSGRVFECKTCSRRFPSFQALGGHRAKHKKPRPVGDRHGQTQVGAAKPRVHECSI
ncbi:unnamed protein product [Musa acuminata subsp. malaccensis]|uniref:(wild Malaysian banana) hypothetical protein n=1 Tax=Musa acuminata subsp. malaccensis TaxID=214687 RepID=A0A804K246_MUSAM|nr:unnamed protein product [Musa acuminata subsp. malaccensis]